MKKIVVRIILVVLALGLICIYIVNSSYIRGILRDQYWPTKLAEIQNHKQAWSEQKITKYKMGIRSNAPLHCSQELVVEDNIAIQKSFDSCYGYISLTVDTIFTIIESQIRARECGPNGCACDSPIIVNVVYDGKYKFPKTAQSNFDTYLGWIFDDCPNSFARRDWYMWDVKDKLDYEIYSFQPIE